MAALQIVSDREWNNTSYDFLNLFLARVLATSLFLVFSANISSICVREPLLITKKIGIAAKTNSTATKPIWFYSVISFFYRNA